MVFADSVYNNSNWYSFILYLKPVFGQQVSVLVLGLQVKNYQVYSASKML
jgi:hypothetical protein